MIEILTVVAALLALVSAVSFYLASPHQKLIGSALPKKAMWALSAATFVGSLVMLNFCFGSGTAVFFLATIIMITWTILPVTAAYLRNDSGRANK